MLVRNWMSSDVITVDPDASIQEAIKLLKKHDIRMLPVMDKGELVGIVTDRDLKKASVSEDTSLELLEFLYHISETKIKEIMTKDPITVTFDYTVEETAAVLLTNKISGVPVVSHEGQVIGVITQTDLFTVLMSMTGLGKRGIQHAFMEKRGIQFGFMVDDRAGSIKELADIIRKYGGRMRSILTSYQNCPKGYRRVYIRMYHIDRTRLPQLKEELSDKARLLYMVDHRLNVREVYEEA